MAAITPIAFDTTHGLKEAEICNKALYRLGAEIMKFDNEDTKQSRACKAVYAQTRDELLRNYPFTFAKKKTLIYRDDSYAGPLGEYLYAYKVTDPFVFTATRDIPGLSLTVTAFTSPASVLEPEDFTNSLIGRVVSGTGIAPGSRVTSVTESATQPIVYLDRAPTITGSQAGLTMKIDPLKIIEIASQSLFDLVGSGDNQRILCSVVTDANSGDADTAYRLEMTYVDRIVDPDLFDPMFEDALVLRIASKIAVQLTNSPRMADALQAEFAAIMNLAKQTASEERQTEIPEENWTSQAKG